MAKEKKYKNILIFEDDFYFVAPKRIVNLMLNNFFNSEFHDNYNVLMLSYNLKKFEPTKNKYLLKVLNAKTTSGYLITEKYYDTFLELLESKLELLKTTKNTVLYAIDQCWCELQEKDNWYCFKERLGKQMKGYSDIQKKKVNYNV